MRVGIFGFFFTIVLTLNASFPARADERNFASIRDLNRYLGGEILKGPRFKVQTGPYAQIELPKGAINSKCMNAIVQAAYRLHRYFPDYTFVIDSQIQSCQNLRDGVKRMVADAARVRRHLHRLRTPLHGIFLSQHSGFNRRELGKMGLYVNVNRAGEIERRLIGHLPLRLSRASLER